jgi:uncharacterized HAD superfamily protein
VNKELKLWLDIDGVIGEFERHFLTYLNLPLHHPKEWDDKRFKNNITKVDYDHNFWITMPYIFNPEEFNYTISGYCTARNCHIHTIREWLVKGGFPDVPIISVGLHGSKIKALKGVDCDIFCDDSIRNYEELNNAGIKTFLMSRPHNLSYDVGNDRVDNIKHLEYKIIELCGG